MIRKLLCKLGLHNWTTPGKGWVKLSGYTSIEHDGCICKDCLKLEGRKETASVCEDVWATRPVVTNDQYHLQMAAISAAAHGVWREGQFALPDAKTQALDDVAKLYSKYVALKTKVNTGFGQDVASEFVEQKTNLNFGQALEFLKDGKCLQRAGWNGKGMFVYLVPPASYPVQTGAAKEHFGENAMVPYKAYFAIKNVDITVSTWAPSVNDCLANDWTVL